jgi:hypothetical protein
MNRYLILSLLLLAFSPAFAQQEPGPGTEDKAALEARIKDLEERLISLEGQVRQLKSAQTVSATTAPETPSPSPAPALSAASSVLPTLGGNAAAAKALNPDISIIGDFIGIAGHNPIQTGPSLEMHESEIGMSAIIDPYARGDFFLTFGEEGVGLEEGYITFTSLPAGFVVKAGKMRSAFGKVNTMHNHVLPFVDRPLVTNSLLGGEDGIDDAGVSINRILPSPKWMFLDITGQVFRGDSGTDAEPVFRSSRRSDVSTVARLRAYKDLTESTNLDLGLSFARGHNELGTNFLTHLYGVDATLRWKPLRRSVYHSIVARSELVWRAFGFYTSGEYQFRRRWFLGGRFDWSDRARDQFQTDKGGSVILTYWPSEFSQIRGQYRFTNYAENIKSNELLMQVLFSLGAHGAHPF